MVAATAATVATAATAAAAATITIPTRTFFSSLNVIFNSLETTTLDVYVFYGVFT